jgi:hypothetical protein
VAAAQQPDSLTVSAVAMVLPVNSEKKKVYRSLHRN